MSFLDSWNYFSKGKYRRLLDHWPRLVQQRGMFYFYSRPLIQAWTARALLAGESGGTLGLRRRCWGGSPESGKPVATKLGLLWGLALRDWGDEGDPFCLPWGSGRR
jgi:hypothetical protein